MDEDARPARTLIVHPLILTALIVLPTLSSAFGLARAPGLAVRLAPLLLAGAVLYGAAVWAAVLSARAAVVAVFAWALAAIWTGGVLALGGALAPSGLAECAIVLAAGALVLMQLTARAAAENCRGMVPGAAAGSALRRWAAPGLAVLGASVAGAALTQGRVEVPTAGLIAAAALIVAGLVLTGLLGHLAFGEHFVVRINRAHEHRARVLTPLARLGAPRWAYATLGITAILFVLALFEGGRAGGWHAGLPMLRLWRADGAALGAAGLATALAAGLGTRNWRHGLAAALATLLVSVLAGWLALHLGVSDAVLARLAVAGASAGAAGTIIIAGAMAAYGRFGDDTETAYARALGDVGAVLGIFGLSVAGVLALAGLNDQAAWFGLIFVAAALIAAFVLLPAFAAVLDNLVPRRRSLEDMYGAR